ncbi:MAG: DUF1540 domain-containing protein [Defluviitaleaceae bacterium]|nr:DUF1540 domain-containing protein [Defluviitaleaceae bacterium]
MPSQEIRCNVGSCKFNSAAKLCTLSSIEVGNTTPNAQKSDQTECENFKCE